MRLRVPAVLLVAGVAGALAAVPATAATTADADLDKALKAMTEMKGGPPGAISVVQRGDERAVHRFGLANLKTKAKPRASDHQRQASTSKAFNGAVALSLVNKGVLSLDDTVAQRLPTLPAAWGAVTLRQLLDHTSGLPDFTRDKRYLADLATHPRALILPHARLLDTVASKHLNFTPGSEYEYSNSDNVAAALMTEAATGANYADLLRSEVYAPLGLTQTSLPDGFRLPAPYIHGYDVFGRAPVDISQGLSMSSAWASGGIVSTPAEMNTFIRGYVGLALFGKPVQDQQLRLVAGHSEPIGPGTNFAGVGIFQYRTRCGVVYGHTGSFPGYTQFMAASPDGSRSVTVSVSEALNPATLSGATRRVFTALRSAEVTAVCAALAGT